MARMANIPEGETLGAADLELPAVDLDMPVDVELPAPQQHRMESEGVHLAYVPSNAGAPTNPTSGDECYSKLVCLTCGIGEVLGNTICGEHVQCCCIECMEACGLGGKGGCIEMMSACGLFMPALEFGWSWKILCCKVGLVNPLKEKPLVVFNKKTIA
mmetsp:Transcript_79002/g.176711  ORF Transcript_79002/g.176711 Transcript_79002/m.176711 type:complete len:158 (-) Transcript_79002:79-552(-)